jgi:NTE family protein
VDGNPFEETATLRSDIGVLLGETALFSGLAPELLRRIASVSEWLSLPGGATLFCAGDPPDALYVVLSGCLGVFSPDNPVQRRFLARIAAGDVVGEMGLISGRARSADIVALRDTELARISSEAFNEVLRSQPEAMLRMARLAVDRLERSQSRAPAHARGACTFTVLPQSMEVDFGGFATRLVRALSEHGRAELVWSVRAGAHTSQWFNNIEAANDFVVYVADPTPDRWTKLCVRQADALLLLARADSPAGSWAALRWPHDHSIARSAASSCCFTTASSRPVPRRAGSKACPTSRTTTWRVRPTTRVWRAC